jgi:hypothetical protein
MAEWKKVVVSGSDISQLNNDSNYIADGDSGVSISGSFSGSFFGDGSGLSGVAASFPITYVAPADVVKVFVNDGASKFTSASAFADYTFGKISGDATVAAGGALTIANDAVEISMIADSATGSILNTIAGDVNVSTGGVSTIQASAVEGTMLNTNVADGTTIEVSSNTLSTLKVPNALTAGTGLSAGGTFDGAAARTFAVSYGSSAGTAVQGNTTITLNQTAGEIDITGTAAQALGGAPSYTIGLADTISGNRTFSGNTITINNDLVVQGTASFQETTNLTVADQFILLNSGSTTDNSPGGIVIQQDTQDEGIAFAYDATAYSNTGRWGVTSSFDASSATFDADAYVAMVIDEDNGGSDIALYQQRGNIKIDTSDDIWIYA